jgi:hypothetical protein
MYQAVSAGFLTADECNYILSREVENVGFADNDAMEPMEPVEEAVIVIDDDDDVIMEDTG